MANKSKFLTFILNAGINRNVKLNQYVNLKYFNGLLIGLARFLRNVTAVSIYTHIYINVQTN